MNSFFGIGFMELFFIAVLALIVLGPERLPGAIREIAKHARTLRQMSSELTSQFSEELQALDEINPQKILRELTEDPAEAKKASEASKKRTVTPAPQAQSMNKPAAKTNQSTSGKAAASKPAAAKADDQQSANGQSPEQEETAPDDGPDATPRAPENSIMPPQSETSDAAQSAATADSPAHERPAVASDAPLSKGDTESAPVSLNGVHDSGVHDSGVHDKPEDAA